MGSRRAKWIFIFFFWLSLSGFFAAADPLEAQEQPTVNSNITNKSSPPAAPAAPSPTTKRKKPDVAAALKAIAMPDKTVPANAPAPGSPAAFSEERGNAQEVSLLQLVRTGGFVMIVLIFLSFITVGVIVYNFMTLNLNQLVPPDFVEELIKKLDQGNEKEVLKLCEEENVISDIVLAGLEKKHRGRVFAREAMELCVRKEIGTFWRNINYLADIAAIAPFIGLLGTVIGMIRAFNAIAFQVSIFRPTVLVGGVSQAMVTTAGGLIVAIPALLFYFYFKGRVIQITHAVEGHSAEIIKIIEEAS